jgi:hypothetical protein
MTTPTQPVEPVATHPLLRTDPGPGQVSLHDVDETAWLDRTATLIREHRFSEIDSANLSEYLGDMAKRDRREVLSRLVVLLAHLLKWTQHPEHRSSSWRTTIRTQRMELSQLFESATLRRHAEEVLFKAYAEARAAAADDMEIAAPYPTESPWTVQTALSQEL